MHAAVAAETLADRSLVERVLDDHTTAPISDKFRATLTFVRKLTLTPDEVGAEDIRAMLELGVTREAIRDAIYIVFLFCIYDRVADVLDWETPNAAIATANARMLARIGYP